MWRFDHIDVAKCPQLPDRFVAEAKKQGHSPDMLRASQAIGLSTKELNVLAAEVA